MKRRCTILLILLCLSAGKLFAQNSQTSLWGAWFHSQKLSDHWGYAFDGQFRSADDVKYLKNILLRPSVAYYFNKNNVLNVGYAYIASNGRTLFDEKTYRGESRIWEQFIISGNLGKNISLANRFRLEQRFLGNTAAGADDSFFTQRLRYFIRGVVPFVKEDVFTKGAFMALQNEVFVNLQNKERLNDNFFDQNRAYIAIGYRFCKKLDIEAGYMNHYTKHFNGNTTNNVAQLAIYTRF